MKYTLKRFDTYRGRRLVVIVVFILAVAGYELVTYIQTRTAINSQEQTVVLGDSSGAFALDVLALLTVKGRAPSTGYSRSQFGDGWAEVNGCDMRNQILARDLDSVEYLDDQCRVSSGTLLDPYTGKNIAFVRGQETSDDIQIDHVVALSDAWQKGAQSISPELRESFANDPLNLLAVDGPTNVAKGNSDSASWLPPNKAYRCKYVARQVAVKEKYGLWVTMAEKNAISRVLGSCPNQRVPVEEK